MNKTEFGFALRNSNGGYLSARLDQYLIDHGFVLNNGIYEAFGLTGSEIGRIMQGFWNLVASHPGKAEVEESLLRDQDVD